MVMVIGRLVYIFFAVVRATVGAVHRSRVVSQRRAVSIRGAVIYALCCFVGWGRGISCWYVFVCNRHILV